MAGSTAGCVPEGCVRRRPIHWPKTDDMKFGFRRPSFRGRIAARTSVKRYVRHSLGLKAPRGMGWLTNPRKAAYNRVYNRTSRGCVVAVGVVLLKLVLFATVVLATRRLTSGG
jgi:hypothetical protein